MTSLRVITRHEFPGLWLNADPRADRRTKEDRRMKEDTWGFHELNKVRKFVETFDGNFPAVILLAIKNGDKKNKKVKKLKN